MRKVARVLVEDRANTKLAYLALPPGAAIPVCSVWREILSPHDAEEARMRHHLIPAIALTQLFALQARADFVVAGSLPSPRPQAASAVPTAPAADETNAHDAGTDSPAAVTPRFRIAQGFGDHVPIRFAVRQIVPRAVTVTYGPGVDPDAVVDWKGGQGWNWVLFRAVHPLGLHLVMTHMAVEIRK
jgi:hypothetical protein